MEPFLEVCIGGLILGGVCIHKKIVMYYSRPIHKNISQIIQPAPYCTALGTRMDSSKLECNFLFENSCIDLPGPQKVRNAINMARQGKVWLRLAERRNLATCAGREETWQRCLPAIDPAVAKHQATQHRPPPSHNHRSSQRAACSPVSLVMTLCRRINTVGKNCTEKSTVLPSCLHH